MQAPSRRQSACAAENLPHPPSPPPLLFYVSILTTHLPVVVFFIQMVTDDKLDYWRHTYYNPPIVKDDGHFLGAAVPADNNYTIEVRSILC